MLGSCSDKMLLKALTKHKWTHRNNNGYKWENAWKPLFPRNTTQSEFSEIFGFFQNFSEMSKNFQKFSDFFRNFQISQNFSEISRNVQKCSEFFRIFQNCSFTHLLCKFQKCSETFRNVQKCSGVFRNVWKCSKVLYTSKEPSKP